MPPAARESLVHALLHRLPEQSSPVVIVVRPEKPAPAPLKTNGHRSNRSTLSYDPSVVLILELSTTIATRDPESVALMGQAVADALQAIVRDAANVHPLVLSRAVYYLLYLVNASQVRRCALMALLYSCTTGSFVCAATSDSSYNCKLQPNDIGKSSYPDLERSFSMFTGSQPAPK